MQKQELHFQEYGDENNSPLLILHGLLGSGDNWRSLAKRYAENFYVITVDLRNHGQSFWDSKMDYELMAQDVLNLITQLNLNKVMIIYA